MVGGCSFWVGKEDQQVRVLNWEPNWWTCVILYNVVSSLYRSENHNLNEISDTNFKVTIWISLSQISIQVHRKVIMGTFIICVIIL
jgi:hypothetical protein